MLENRIRELHADGRFQEAATVAIDGYGPELLSFLSAILRNEVDTDEVFAMTCHDLWTGIREFRFECSFRTWAYLVARHAYARFRRKEGPRRERETLSPIPHLSELEERVRTATRPYLRSALKSRVARLREQLEPEEQMLLVFRIDRKLQWSEVARIMADGDGGEVSAAELARCAATCRKQFERVIARLRHLAEEQGLLSEI